MKYTINAIPPSNNKFKGRQNHWEYRELKKQWETLVKCVCNPKPPKPLENVVVLIKYYFPTKIRHDPDNYSGVFILDGLVKAGILKDDSFDCISLVLDADCDRNNPRTEIYIVEGTEEIAYFFALNKEYSKNKDIKQMYKGKK